MAHADDTDNTNARDAEGFTAEATDAMRHAARSARAGADRTRQELEDALEAAQEGWQEAERYIRENASRHPLATVAVAAGAGVVIGMILGGAGRR